MSMPSFPPGDPTVSLPCAHGGPPLTGRSRSHAEDFVVEERLGFDASGAGEHLLMSVEKTGLNTAEVARLLARAAGVRPAAVGFAGLKDRLAVTRQYFSVQLPGRADPDWTGLPERVRVLYAVRHDRKLRRGALAGNRFCIVLREIAGDRDAAVEVCRAIARAGVPNYFGPQRFGRDGTNVPAAAAMFAGEGKSPGRERRGMLLSAARSLIFNDLLGVRVADGTWQTLLEGEVVALDRSRSHFPFDPLDASLPERLAAFDVHPSGPLPGRAGRALAPRGEAAALEARVLARYPVLTEGVQRFGVDADRRALRTAVRDFSWALEDDALTFAFELPAGSYATAVLREVVAEPG
jgi:tRNA pseudouridine13 synthase